MNATLTRKIISGFLVVVLVSFLSSILTVYQVGGMEQEIKKIKDSNLPILMKSMEVAVNSQAQPSAIRGYVITGNTSYLDQYQAADKRNSEMEEELIKMSYTDTGRKLSSEIKALDDKYSEIVEKKLIPLKKAGGRDAEVVRVMTEEAGPASLALTAKINEYTKFRQGQINGVFQDMVAVAESVFWWTIVLSIVVVVLSFVVGFYTARSIAGPVKQLTMVANDMADGDFSNNIEVIGKDEVGQLAQAFKIMAEKVGILIRNVQDNAQQLAASSEELTASAQQAAQVSHQVAESITLMAHGSEKQSTNVSQTSDIIAEMATSLQKTADNTVNVTGLSDKAAEATQGGQSSVNKAIAQMQNINKGTAEAQTAVNKLATSSQQIGEIVNVISAIAGQTNLLALNAAIEAARAGEQGRGFAVVAEEVRKLAEQSQGAAQQITALINENQVNMQSAVQAMQIGINDVKSGSQVVEAAGDSFGEIAKVVKQVSDKVREISVAVEMMAKGSDRIVNSISTIDHISRDNVAETQTVSAATEEQAASMQEIANASNALATMSMELQNAVGKFKV